MATYVLTIGGTTKSIHTGGWKISESANGRSTMDFSILSLDGTYRPTLGQEVIFTEDGTRIFGGLISDIQEKGLGGYGITPIVSQVTAIDFSSYTERHFLKTTIPAGTLKAALTVIATDLSGYGVTLADPHDNGPDLDELIYDWVRIDEVLNGLAAIVPGYVWQIDYEKKLRMIDTLYNDAPHNFTDGSRIIGDLTIEHSRQNYANRVTVRFSEAAVAAWAFISGTILNGETITIGSTTYTFDSILTDNANHVKIGATNDDTYINLGLAMEAEESTGQGTLFGTATNKNSAAFGYLLRSGMFKAVARNAGDSGNSVAVNETSTAASWYWEGGGATSTLAGGLDEALTNEASDEDSGEIYLMDLWEIVLACPEIKDLATAQALATAELERAVACKNMKTISYETADVGYHPGQYQNIVLSARGLNGNFTITDVEIFSVGNLARRRITAQGGDGVFPRWQDDAKTALSGGSNVTGATLISGGSGGGSIIIENAQPGPVWLGGGQEVRTRVITAGTWYTGFNTGEPVFDSYKMPPTINLYVLMLADAITGGNAQCRVVAGTGNWSDKTVVSAACTPVTDGANWVWQSIVVTMRTGVYAYRMEMTSSVNASDVGFRAYLQW